MTRNNFFLLCLAGGLSMAGLQSCQKQTSSMATIKGIRACLPSPNDSALSFVNPGQNITIDGTDLMTTQEITFDGVVASYNSALTANTSLSITVPSIPFSTVDTSSYNTIVLYTTHGKLVYKFPVVPPPPSVAAISNEFAHPGDVITLTGQYLYLIKSVTFPGGIPATTYSSTPDGSTLTVTVPAGATTGGGIIVASAGGTSSTLPAAGFNDMRGMLCDFDTYNQYSWGASAIANDPSYTGNNGNFAELIDAGIPGGDQQWWNTGRSVNTNGVQWVATDSMSNPIGDYAMKFEIYAKVPWVEGSFYVVPNYTWTYLAAYAPWKTAVSKSFTSTTQWSTVVIPLTNFQTNNGAGSSASSLSSFIGGGNQVINIMFVNDGSTPIASFNMGIDNIRVVKVK